MPTKKDAPVRMARKRKTAETSRDELIDAAIEVIGRKGLSGTTLADVAEKAGVGYGNVTFRFKTKAALLLAALEKVTSEYLEQREAAALAPDQSAAQRLDALISASFHRKVTSQKKIALWHAFLSECHIHADYRRLFANLREREYELTRGLCDEIIASGESTCKDPHVLAIGVHSLVEGLWFGMRLGPNPLGSAEALRIARSFLASLIPTTFRETAEEPELQTG